MDIFACFFVGKCYLQSCKLCVGGWGGKATSDIKTGMVLEAKEADRDFSYVITDLIESKKTNITFLLNV